MTQPFVQAGTGRPAGEALSEGVEALGDTASAIGDDIGGAVSAVGGWFD
ncbi:hypothetical protein QE370_001299 [Aeromicrobium sp. SORGH_AS981]|nr:hypothetical protein [Aeromicrobium sp. SORGH_AS_0981]MDR6118115.1 hypothetical protein [Aeromicrobium sp. SORGH_AS_0981]